MKRAFALLLMVAVVAGLGPAATARGKRPKPARAVTYYMVPEGDGCMLSIDEKLVDPSKNCSRSPEVITSVTPSEPVEMPARDGLPLRLDVTRPVRGVVSVWSWHLVSNYGPTGIGEAQVTARLTGRARGEEVLIGETTTDPYAVTPESGYYSIEFEITPDAATTGVLFEELILSLRTSGTTAQHGGFNTGSLTIGVVAAR